MVEKFSAIILAGGHSRRFGRDKALVEWRGKRMIDYVVEAARRVAGEVIVVRRKEQTLECDADCFAFDNLKDSEGPLRGIIAGLKKCSHSKAFVLACDSPLVQPELLNLLAENFAEEQLALAAEWDGFTQPLTAIYAKDFYAGLEDFLHNYSSSPARALKHFNCPVMPEASCRKADPKGLTFKNINRADDLIALEDFISRD